MRRAGAAGVLAALFALAGCAAPVPASTPTPTTRAAPEADPQAAIAAFDAAVAEIDPVGAFLLVRTPDGEFTSSYGSAEDGADVPITGDTAFRIASNTKVMTGTIILQLVDEGRIALADPVSKYWDGVPNGDAITITDLLDMRSGIADYESLPGVDDGIYEDPSRYWSPQELLALGFAEPPTAEPDTEFHYSNTSTILLGLIAERVTGEQLDRLFTERLFDPLGLDASVYPVPHDTAMPEGSAHGYSWHDGELVDITELDPSIGGAAGAAISTARDAAAWIEAMTDGALLSPELQKLRMDSLAPISPDSPTGYGLAILGVRGYYGHTGEIPGFNSVIVRDPARDLTIVLWSNQLVTEDGTAPAEALFPIVVDALG